MSRACWSVAAVVAAAAAVTYALRALPFAVAALRRRALPAGAERFGELLAPAMLAALVVYSFGALEWRTPWPYLALAATVALQLLARSPLASIAAGTALYMALVACAGCAAPPPLEYDGAHPLLAITGRGIRFGGEYVTPAQAVERLESRGIPKDATIHILLEDGYDDRRAPWVFQHNYLGKAGYRRTILVRPRRSESCAVGRDAAAPRRELQRRAPGDGR